MSNKVFAAEQRRLNFVKDVTPNTMVMRNGPADTYQQPQTQLGFAGDIIAFINRMLQNPQTSDQDKVVLKSMIGMLQVNDKKIYSGLKEVIQTQMQLECATRRALAKGVRPLDSRLTVVFEEDEGDHVTRAGPIARFMANIACLKIAMDLNISVLKGKQRAEISRIFNFFAYHIKLFDEFHKMDDLPSNDEPDKICKLLHLNVRSKEFRRRWKAFDPTLGMKRGKFGTVEPPLLFLPPVQVIRYSDLLAVYRGGFTLPKQLRLELEALEKEVGIFKSVIDSLTCLEATLEELDDARLAVEFLIKHAGGLAELSFCRDRLNRRRFSLPKQLRMRMEDLGGESDGAAFSKLDKQITHFEVLVEAFETPILAVEFLFNNAEDLENLDAEIDLALTTQTRKRKSKRTKRPEDNVPPSPVVDIARSPSPPREAAQDDARNAAIDLTGEVRTPSEIPSERSLPNHLRDISVSLKSQQVRFMTYLSNSKLHEMLRRDTDAGTFAREHDEPTFAELKTSAAYHINKHAPHMLAEEYVSQGLELLPNWFGEIAERKARGHDNLPSGDQGWVRIVRSQAGVGAFNLEDDKLIWWQPPLIQFSGRSYMRSHVSHLWRVWP